MSRTFWRSVGALALGFVTVVVLSLGTDQVLHMLQVYPPLGQPMSGVLFAFATAYRHIYTILGGYVIARAAPHSPVRHAVIGGIIGILPGIGGVVATLAKPELGPLWYPIAILVTGLPCTWVGGRLFAQQAIADCPCSQEVSAAHVSHPFVGECRRSVAGIEHQTLACFLHPETVLRP